MARRDPFTAADIKGRANTAEVDALSAEDLAELMRNAAVPKDKRPDFAAEVNCCITSYRQSVTAAAQEKPLRQAESLRQLAEKAQDLRRAIYILPPSLRMEIEPDLIGLVRRPGGGGRLSAAWRMPGFDELISALIETVNKRLEHYERRVSGELTRKGGTHGATPSRRVSKDWRWATHPRLASARLSDGKQGHSTSCIFSTLIPNWIVRPSTKCSLSIDYHLPRVSRSKTACRIADTSDPYGFPVRNFVPATKCGAIRNPSLSRNRRRCRPHFEDEAHVY